LLTEHHKAQSETMSLLGICTTHAGILFPALWKFLKREGLTEAECVTRQRRLTCGDALRGTR